MALGQLQNDKLNVVKIQLEFKKNLLKAAKFSAK
jgi:hypothetical protein